MDYPHGKYQTLKKVIVPSTKVNESRSFAFYDTFPPDKERKYRVTVDSEDWVCESNEGNNEQTAGWLR